MLSDQDRASSYLDTDPFTRGGAAISQTPAQAMSSKHFIISIIFVSISNWIINFGITALSFLSHDRTGLWRSESFVTIDGHRVYYADAPIVADLGISTFLLVFFVTIATTGGVRKAILQGKTLPIPTQEYRRVLRYLGVTIRNVFLRGAIYALYALAIIYPVTMLIFYAECEGGAMHVFNPPGTDDEHCYMRKWGFIFFKAGWCTCHLFDCTCGQML